MEEDACEIVLEGADTMRRRSIPSGQAAARTKSFL
jgi:hypothetical protein